MANSFTVLVMLLLTLVLGAGAETLLPKLLGVGFPVLMSAVQFAAVRRSAAAATLFAIAAGAMEDALSALPMATSASFFLALAAFSRWSGTAGAAAALAYPAYRLWLFVWTGRPGGGIFVQVLAAVPVGVLTACAVGLVLGWAEGKAALDEEG